MTRRVSLPHEHGALVTLVAAFATGAAIAPAHLAAASSGILLLAAFFARAPIEQRAAGHAATFDGSALLTLGLLSAIAATAAIVSGADRRLLGLATAWAIGILASSYLARRIRLHRDTYFEILGMAVLGASVVPVALVGQASLRTALAAGIVLATHAAASVPLVRSELRPRERALANEADARAALLIVAGGLAVYLVGMPLLACALAPRALHLLARRLRLSPSVGPLLVGLRETAEVTLVMALLMASIALRGM